MNLLKIAVGMNFLASALFALNAGVTIYMGKDNYLQHLGLALMFFILAFFYRAKYKKQMKKDS